MSRIKELEAELEELHRKSMRIRAKLVARRHATVLCEMAVDEVKLLGETEMYRLLRAKADTATQIAEMIGGLSLNREGDT